MERGFIHLWRKTLDSGILQDGPTLQLFLYLLLKATHKPLTQLVSGQVVNLAPGQLVFGRKKAACELGLSEQSVRTAMKRLENMKISTSQPTNRFSIISIVNWHLYQGGQPAANQQNNQPPTNSQPAANQPLTTNKNKEDLRVLNTPPHPPQGGDLLLAGEAEIFRPKEVAKAEDKPARKKRERESTVPDIQAEIACYATGDEKLSTALEAFRAMRAKMRKPLTLDALRLTCRDLEKLCGEDVAGKVAVLEQSVQRGWQGVFAVKAQDSRASPMTGALSVRDAEVLERDQRARRMLARRQEAQNAQYGRHAGFAGESGPALPAGEVY